MQALARVWRDGQKKDCTFILLSDAGQDANSRRRRRLRVPLRRNGHGRGEKCVHARPLPHKALTWRSRSVFQRQSHKQNLSSCVVDAKEDIERHYTGESLRQLFQYKEAACEVRFVIFLRH